MKYIWVNPVAAGMYEPKILDEFLNQHGYKRFETSIDWLNVVREKYREVVGKADKTVIDMRCPKAVEAVKKFEISKNFIFPEIYPILIHCGQEAGMTVELLNAEKIITTPCKALADMGNALKIPKTEFVPWIEFLKFHKNVPKANKLPKSPIPPGYFESLNVKCKSLTGEEAIRDYITHYQPDGIQLIEMLYCKDGCHNGDGVCFE